MLKSKKILSILLAVMMLVQTLVIPGIAAEIDGFEDFPVNSWSTEAMTAAVDNGLLKGTSETTIEPEKNLTRAEFAAIITRAFGATKTADISKFKDVAEKDWYYGYVAKAVQMGVMNGTGETTFDPDAFMKREDVILSLARVLFVDGKDTSVLNQFSDRNEIDTWAIAGISGMVAEGYVNGYEDGSIRPKNFITRQELAQLFHNMFRTYISEEGEYNKVAAEGSVIVRSKDVTLKDVTVNGDLVLADGIGDGDFRLTNVDVKGKIIARGGEGTVYFVNVTADGKVIINDPNGTVNFHNYRDDTPFRGNLTENTPATFLERKPTGSSSAVSGGTSKITFYDGNNKLDSFGKNDEIDVTAPDKDGYEFAGWAKLSGETDPDKIFSAEEIDAMDFSDAKGKWYAIYYTVVRFYENNQEGTAPKTEIKNLDGNYVIADADIPTDDEMAVEGKFFRGWTDGIETKTRDYFVGNTLKNVKGNWYAVYVDAFTFTVSFKYVDGTEALPTVTKTFAADEDYTLTADDVKDVQNNIAPTDYEFLGWTETVDGTDYKTSADLRVSIKDLDGKTYYARFNKVTDNYSVAFKYVDGVEALPTVTKTLAASEDYTLTADDVKDVVFHTNPDDYEFLGWTDTVGGTDYKTSESLRVSIKDLDGKTYYAQFRKVTVEYSVSFKYIDGTNALDTVTKELAASEDYTLTAADVKDVEHNLSPEDYEFLGWTETVDGTDYISSAELRVSIKALDGKTYYAQFNKLSNNYAVAFKYNDGTEALSTVTKTLAPSEDYVLTADDVKDVEFHTNPEDYEFLGWTETVDGTDYKTSADLRVSIKDLDGKTFYAQFKKLGNDYAVSFKYNDGAEALPTVTKTLAPSEDYVLTADDVKDVEFHTNPGDYEFLGWTTEVDGTDYIASEDLRASIKTLEEVYYAQFKKLGDTYKVSFLYTNGDEALPAVEEILAPSEDYVLTESDIKDVEHYDEPVMYEFLGWTTEIDGTDYITSEALRVSIKTLEEVYYAQFKHVDSVEYKVEHYFEQLDGTYVAKETEILYAFPTDEVTAEAIAQDDLPDGYFENTTHADRVASGTVVGEDDANYPLTLKLYYDLEVIKVVFNAMWEDDIAIPGMTYFVKHGGNIDNFYDPDGVKSNDEIKAEIDEYVEENYEIGYSKDYDNAYLYHEFEPEDNDGLYEHRINYNWYVEDEEEEFVLFDKEAAVTEDINVFIKLKKLNIEISFPDKITNEILTINMPYDEYTRFVDSLRDLVYINENIAGFPEKTGIEDEIYDKIADVDKAGEFFENGSLFNGEFELNNINKLIRFSQLMGEEGFESFLNSFITGNQNLMAEIEEKLIAYIKGADHEETAKQLKELVDALIVEHEEDAHNLVNTLIKDLIADESGVKLLEEFMTGYVTTLVNSEEQADKDMLLHLEDMICDMFASYRDSDPDAFRSFVTTTIVDSLSGTTPNATIKGMIAEYINEMIESGEFDDEIEDGAFDTQIYNYIMGMSHDAFVAKVNEVLATEAGENILDSVIEAEIDNIIQKIEDEMDPDEIKAKIKTELGKMLRSTEDDDIAFRNSVIDEIFNLNNSSVDAEILNYIKTYNLADQFINDNLEDYITDYIEDESNRSAIVDYMDEKGMWAEIIEEVTGYAGVDPDTLTEQDKLDALDEYLTTVDGAVANIINKVGIDELKGNINEDEMIDDYFKNNRSDVKDKMKSTLTSNSDLRNEFADYVVANFENDDFAPFLDAKIEEVKENYVKDYIEEHRDEYVDDFIDDYLADLALEENYDDKEALVNKIVSHVRSDSSIITGAVGSDVIVDYVVEDIAEKANDDDPATESEYVGYIRDYVDDIDDGNPDSSSEFSDIVNKFIHADESFRNDIIVKLFEELYHDETDPDHDILIGFMTKVTDEMIASGEIELGVLELIVEYVNEPGHGDELVHDIVEVLLQVENIIEFATEHLGVVDNTGKLDAANKFKNEVTYEQQFEVTEANLFIMEMVHEKVASMSFDAFLDDFVAGKIPEALLDKLPLGIVENIYNDSINGFLSDLEDAIAAVEGGSTEPQYVNSGVILNINLVTDLLVPVMEFAEDSHNKAVEKAVASGNIAAELVEKYYVDNPYVIGAAGNKGVVNYAYDPDLYVSDEDGDGYYSIKSFKDIYTSVVMPESVESIDAFLWMMDDEGGCFPFEKIKNFALENEDLILALYNHPNALMARYAEEGLPEDMAQYYEDLLENDEIREAVEKIDNKVAFDMQFFVEEKLQTESLKMYFLKALERFGVKIEVVLEKYTNSSAYKEFTEEMFEKIVDEIDMWWGDDEVEIDGEAAKIENFYGTTDYVFDTFFDKVAGEDHVASVSVKGFEMTVTRFFADYLEQAAPAK